ncbi:hypothetical protein G3436_26100 [Pseudomonas sp. MAFF212427]|uniref:Peptidase M41 domain-containing protein n=2 Tax=Pseudomonas brassicae TaxID=2708063 RepID=A0A6B3NX86_9PSED|nr:hypothetical protein [Pseudomonas brassicae]NER66689.1 hypothetical protein [Pseudomonas brassicae]
MDKRPRCTAIHEAGHALAVWWNGQPITRVTVLTHAQASSGPLIDLKGNPHAAQGLVEADYLIVQPAFAAPRIAEYLPSLVEPIERDLLHCLAGPVAEAMYQGVPPDRVLGGSGRGDRCRGHELIRLLPAHKLLDAEPLAIARSRTLLRRYWAAVTAVADLLQARGTVDGEAVCALLSAVTGEPSLRRSGDLHSLDR